MTPGNKLLAIFVLIVVFCGGIAMKVYQASHSPVRVMSGVVEPMITKIADAKWSGAILYKYATPEFQTWMIDHKLTNGMPGFSLLGKVKKFDGIKQVQTDETGDFAILVAAFEFEKGTADITLQLAKRYDRWMIYTFNISSPLFQQTAQTTTKPPDTPAPPPPPVPAPGDVLNK